MRNHLGVPVPGWTVLASWTGWVVVVLAAIAVTVGEFSAGVLLVVVPITVATGALLAAARLATVESRRQTAVVRGALGYRWGEQPRSWRWHAGMVALAIYLCVVQLWFALDGGDVADVAWAVFYVVWIGGLMVLSTVGKWRRERRTRASGPVPLRASPSPRPPVVELPPQPVRGA